PGAVRGRAHDRPARHPACGRPPRAPRPHRRRPRRRRAPSRLDALGSLGAISGPCSRGLSRTATAWPGRCERWGLGAISGPCSRGLSRTATAWPRRCERWGLGGHFGAPVHAGCREPPRLGRGGASVGGLGAISGPCSRGLSRTVTAWPGRCERWGAWGPFRAPCSRGLSRTVTTWPGRRERWGLGGHLGAPRHGGGRELSRLGRGGASVGGLGAISGPPSYGRPPCMLSFGRTRHRPVSRGKERPMADSIRLVEYFYVTTPNKPGVGASMLGELRRAGVN